MSIKRLNYFNHQFLEEKDFRDEQQYHLEMRRRLNRSLHIWGIAEGLEVARSGNREVTVAPGFAIDREGRELVVVTPIARDIGSSEHHHKELHVLLSHKERFEEAEAILRDGVRAQDPDSPQRLGFLLMRELRRPDEAERVLRPLPALAGPMTSAPI